MVLNVLSNEKIKNILPFPFNNDIFGKFSVHGNFS